MNILTRTELCRLIKNTGCIKSGIIDRAVDEVYSRESSIQPCSLDLHIGEMYIPGEKVDAIGGVANPNTDSVTLEPGGSLLVRTEEQFDLPTDIGGICFGPARLSLKGLQIVNIGHIDPGFKGKLHFTVINLGKERFNLRKNDEISTLLLFRLTQQTESFGPEESVLVSGKNVSKVVNDALPRLADTFMDFESKAQSIAKKEVAMANILVPIIIAAITILVPMAVNSGINYWSDTKALKDRVETLETQIKQYEQNNNADDRLDRIENMLNITKEKK
jgi:deoxycytidine triphosphate deaminase